ncbi:MAG: response regulator transcription factor [Planctomycetota bacterium]
MRVLLIEDDIDLAATIGEYLEARACDLRYAYDGLTGLHLAASERWDALVLDLTLPGADGLDVCRRLREMGGPPTPILALTARDTLEDKVRGFEAGVDDYLVKPFALAELHLRLRALHRRATPHAAGAVLQIEDLVVDVATQTVARDGIPVRLSKIGFAFLLTLVRAAPAMVSKDELTRAIWGDALVEPDLLRSHLYLLRRAVDRPFATPLIHTVHGRGYRVGREAR